MDSGVKISWNHNVWHGYWLSGLRHEETCGTWYVVQVTLFGSPPIARAEGSDEDEDKGKSKATIVLMFERSSGQFGPSPCFLKKLDGSSKRRFRWRSRQEGPRPLPRDETPRHHPLSTMHVNNVTGRSIKPSAIVPRHQATMLWNLLGGV